MWRRTKTSLPRISRLWTPAARGPIRGRHPPLTALASLGAAAGQGTIQCRAVHKAQMTVAATEDINKEAAEKVLFRCMDSSGTLA